MKKPPKSSGGWRLVAIVIIVLFIRDIHNPPT